jgi:hypothetical protein
MAEHKQELNASVVELQDEVAEFEVTVSNQKTTIEDQKYRFLQVEPLEEDISILRGEVSGLADALSKSPDHSRRSLATGPSAS